MDSILEFLQRYKPLVDLLTLVFVGVYVFFTWRMATASKDMIREVQETRRAESAPHVICFFDIIPDKRYVFFVVKNLGRTSAEEVKLAFDQAPRTIFNKELDQSVLIKEGIGSLAPNAELRTFVGTTVDLLSKGRNARFVVRIMYRESVSKMARDEKQVLDLEPWRDVVWVSSDVERNYYSNVDKIAKASDRISRYQGEIASSMKQAVVRKSQFGTRISL